MLRNGESEIVGLALGQRREKREERGRRGRRRGRKMGEVEKMDERRRGKGEGPGRGVVVLFVRVGLAKGRSEIE